MERRVETTAARRTPAGERVDGLTVVIPIYNERDNIVPAFEELTAALDRLEGWTCEVIWVDDGSKDGSYDLLRQLPAQDSRHHVIRFRRNFGQTAALAAGFEAASKSVIVTLDGDLQNDPNDIPLLLTKLREGYDIVNGWRKNRRDPRLTRILPSRFANWLISRVTGVRLHDYGCTLKAYKADVARSLSLHGDLHRFIPALASWYGVDVAEVPVNHRPRLHGSSKYGIGRTARVVVDLISVKFFLDYSSRPGHVFGVTGLLLSIVGGGTTLYLAVERLVFAHPLADRPAFLLSVLLVVLGLQFIGIGLLAEMITRAHRESSGQRPYAVREVIGDLRGSSPAAPSSGAGFPHLGRPVGAADRVHDTSDGGGREKQPEHDQAER